MDRSLRLSRPAIFRGHRPATVRFGRAALLVAQMLLLGGTVSSAEQPKIDFQRQVLPILSGSCFQCHGPDAATREAGLRLDVAESATGPLDSGERAIVPGDAGLSALLFRTTSDSEFEQMPPPGMGEKLSAEQIDILTRWIEQGAEYQPHWAFVAPQRPEPPAVAGEQWVRNPIDRFVLARLESEGWEPSPEADRATLIRRLSIDLTGLPPTPEEVAAFVNDPDPQAYENLVDRLLADPHYGERMALPWLDAARYADSNGFQQDGDTWQWIWRDWVVKALNDDMPFDQFTIEQLAGDLLPEATTEQKIAGGFNRNHMLNGEGGAIAEEQRYVILFDRVDTTSTTWLGLTMACAQCHDHKYDPISHAEYFSLMDAFNRVPESGLPQRISARIRVAAPFIELPTEENLAHIADLEARMAEAEDDGRRNALKRELDAYRADQIPRVMVMSDERPRETRILDRGDYQTPTEKVSFGTPAFLPPMPEDAPQNRLGLAQWLVAAEHPLTARVQVNRFWQHYFGLGLVRSSEDFGVQSEYPIHQDLLDWLAVEFRESGWSMKGLHRLIVSSATYRQSSRMTEAHRERDSENRLYARGSRFRMPSMLLRDWALASSGLLQNRIGGPPVYPYQPDGIWESLAITKERDFTYPASTGEDLYRRSLYTFWRRTVSPANMFDASDRQVCRVSPGQTSTPLHALTTLNDPTWVEAARALAQRARAAGDTPDDWLSDAFRRVLVREPSEDDLAILRRAFRRQSEIYGNDTEAALAVLAVGESPRDETLDPAEHAALAAVCLAIFNLDEALTRQ